jgi:hypothetical protein
MTDDRLFIEEVFPEVEIDDAKKSAFLAALMQYPPGTCPDQASRLGAVRRYAHALLDGPRTSDRARVTTDGAASHSSAIASAPKVSSPWSRAVPANALLNEPDAAIEWIAEGIAAPGSITGLASPRGLGKTHVLHALAVAVASGTTFCAQSVQQGRVLLIDRDNSRREIRRRLRGWCGGDPPEALEVLTRDDAPALTDAHAWASFPFDRYKLVVLDSLGAATEGVSENNGGETGEALAPLLDLARRGPATLVALNVPKNGKNYRGSGVIADRLDVLYEVRDATDLTPSAKDEAWWSQLPEAGEAAWAERAQRRGRRDDYRLVLVPSKFRIGEEPEPTALEVDLTPGAWALSDVTADLVTAHAEARGEATAAAEAARAAALDRLVATVRGRHAAGKALSKREAEDKLKELLPGARRTDRRTLVEAGGDGRWRLDGGGTRGDPYVLVPADVPASRADAARNAGPADPRGLRRSEPSILADGARSGQPESSSPKSTTGAAAGEPRIWPSDGQNTPAGPDEVGV